MGTRVIIDANMFGLYLNLKMEILRKWIEKGLGILVYTNDSRHKYSVEIGNIPKAQKYFTEMRRTNLHLVKKEDIKKVEQSKLLDNEGVRSNDKHILALALVGKVSILCTNDKDLQTDFIGMNTLMKINNLPHRSVYPHNADRKTKQDFLYSRK